MEAIRRELEQATPARLAVLLTGACEQQGPARSAVVARRRVCRRDLSRRRPDEPCVPVVGRLARRSACRAGAPACRGGGWPERVAAEDDLVGARALRRAVA